MPTIEAVASITIPEGLTATASLSVEPGTSVDYEATADITVDGSALVFAQATGGTVQEAGVEFYVGGTLVPMSALVGTWSVRRNRRQATQEAEFSVKLDEWGVSPLGDPWATLGPPTGLSRVDVYGCYRDTTTGVVTRFPLLLDGIVDNSHRESSPQSGHIEVFHVLDKGALYDRVPVTKIFPTGHGLTRGRMVKALLTEAGETMFRLEDGRKGYMERQFVDVIAPAASQELIDVEGRILRWDRDAYAVNNRLSPPPTQPAILSIDETHILAMTPVSPVWPADVITEVTATGTEQVLSDATAGDVTGAPQETRVIQTFAVWEASFQQTAIDGTLTPLTRNEPVREQLFTLTINRVTKNGGVVKREESESWAYYNPVSARTYWDGSAWSFVIDGVAHGPVFLDADGTPGGSETAYRWQRAKWVLIGRTVKTSYYDAPGWTAGAVDGDPSLHLAGSDTNAAEPTGMYLGSVTENYGFYVKRTALKDRGGWPGGTPFDSIDPIDGVLRLASGEAVSVQYESLQLTNRIVELVTGNNTTGLIETAKVATRGYAPQIGGDTYQFSDGTLSSQQHEVWQEIGSTLTSYSSTDENTHNETVVVTERGKSPVVTNTTGISGAGEAINYLPGYEPYHPEDSLSEEDQSFAVDANPGETRPIKVTVSAPDLELTHLPSIHKASYPYAETPDELASAAVDVIQESAIVRVPQVTLAANFLIAENDVINVTHRPSGLGVARRSVIDAIEWTGGPQQPTVTNLSLDIYTDVAA